MKTIMWLAAVAVLGCAPSAHTDVIILKSGKVINGSVIQRDPNGVLIKLDYGTFTYPLSMVRDVQQEESATEQSEQKQAEEPDQRFPRWGKIITELAKRKWATELKQIPATVIDNGIFQNVPYSSFRCAFAYEINIYGDPDNPVGFEIGVSRHLLNDENAKSNCVAFMSSVLPAERDKLVVRNLNWIRDLVSTNGFVFEITPATDPDAYGAWWISVYSTDLVAKARASEQELRTITEFRPPPIQYQTSTTPTISKTAQPTTSTPSWSREDFQVAAPYRAPSSSGSVYVRGYHRKDGTYVHPHTRRAPRR
jgi:hypothetical protein